MKPNYFHIIDRCIDEGVQFALVNHDHLDSRDIESLAEKISTEIWCQLDMYFNFDDSLCTRLTKVFVSTK